MIPLAQRALLLAALDAGGTLSVIDADDLNAARSLARAGLVDVEANVAASSVLALTSIGRALAARLARSS